MKTSVIRKALLFLPRKIFIAGRTKKEVLGVAARLNSEGFLTTIDVLGEHSKDENEAEKALSEYKQLVDEIRRRGIQSTISIKLTHLGLELSFGYCFNVVKDLVVYARRSGIGIEFDMEEYKHNSETIEIFQSLSKPEDGNRICLQANLFNSFDNLENLHDQNYNTRLVRGAYEENSDVAYWNQVEIGENFKSLINLAIKKMEYDWHNNITRPRHAIGTRDTEIINHVRLFIEASPLDKNCIEFQLLYGYLALGRQLLSEGYPVRIYLPYGNDQTALPYIWRRLKTLHTWKLFFDWLFNFSKTRN